VAREFSGPPTTVSAVGSIFIEARVVDEVTAAVKQALENVSHHANAQQVTVFAEEQDGNLTVSVRDDGEGFVYDEDALKAAGKAGILRSMKGRAEELGGQIQVTSARGKGTEIEFSIPLGAE
jgi:signal transduction histidine kinase